MPMLLAMAMVAAPSCLPRDIRVTTDGANGDFNGMSHSGTYLVIRNAGRRACSVPGLPTVTLRGAGGRVLAARQVPVGMHPGPVIVPVTIPAGRSVAAGLRWVSGPVYDHSRRLDVRSASVVIGERRLSAPVRAAVFVEGAHPGTFEQAVVAAYPARR